jgi:hypothetical protein
MKQKRIHKRIKCRVLGETIPWRDDPRDEDVVRAKAIARERSGVIEVVAR